MILLAANFRRKQTTMHEKVTYRKFERFFFPFYRSFDHNRYSRYVKFCIYLSKRETRIR